MSAIGNYAANYGGFISTYTSAGSSIITVGANALVQSNQCGDWGGAIYSEESHFTFGANFSAVNNTAPAGGGGLMFFYVGNLTFVGPSRFYANGAVYGGAMYLDSANAVDFGSNLSVVANQATNKGGGLYIDNAVTNMSIGYVTCNLAQTRHDMASPFHARARAFPPHTHTYIQIGLQF